MRPQTLEGFGPFVERTDSIRVGFVQHMPPMAAHPDEPYLPKHLEVFRNGWLLDAEVRDEVADRTLSLREVLQNLAPPWLSHSVEGVGGGSGSCHEEEYIFLYGNMSSPYQRNFRERVGGVFLRALWNSMVGME